MQGERREDGCLFFFFFLSTEGFIGYVHFLLFCFFNSLIFFSFLFLFFSSRFGSEMCLREKHGRDQLVGREGELGMKVTRWH